MTNTTNTSKTTTTNKEAKTMQKKTTKKAVTPKVEAQVTAVENIAPKKDDNKSKINAVISIEEVTKMYQEFGIKCNNPNAKGNYRIMGGGSSLNIKPTKGYYIYSSDADYSLIKEAQMNGLNDKDLVIEQGTNAQDKKRPHTVICSTIETLRDVLGVYAMNPANKLVKEESTVPAVVGTDEVAVK